MRLLADEIMMTISNFPELVLYIEGLKRLPPAPQAAPRSRWSRYVESCDSMKNKSERIVSLLVVTRTN
jgi:hypothetical protein